ncbi:hypothetical protein N2601_32295 (plasmid) [Rhizobium sp. CB3060]|uniref:hypothetical protein n=1 Tax=Rhizobium sp. CB3060 TaxID=3138255 RepID=UPI0021A5B1BC|nr:hypothetical protein [Rhizobium tropici]UWU26010.1 hypothetical protein N2601_32295 [Rhizobium tropici]
MAQYHPQLLTGDGNVIQGCWFIARHVYIKPPEAVARTLPLDSPGPPRPSDEPLPVWAISTLSAAPLAHARPP